MATSTFLRKVSSFNSTLGLRSNFGSINLTTVTRSFQTGPLTSKEINSVPKSQKGAQSQLRGVQDQLEKLRDQEMEGAKSKDEENRSGKGRKTHCHQAQEVRIRNNSIKSSSNDATASSNGQSETERREKQLGQEAEINSLQDLISHIQPKLPYGSLSEMLGSFQNQLQSNETIPISNGIKVETETWTWTPPTIQSVIPEHLQHVKHHKLMKKQFRDGKRASHWDKNLKKLKEEKTLEKERQELLERKMKGKDSKVVDDSSSTQVKGDIKPSVESEVSPEPPVEIKNNDSSLSYEIRIGMQEDKLEALKKFYKSQKKKALSEAKPSPLNKSVRGALNYFLLSIFLTLSLTVTVFGVQLCYAYAVVLKRMVFGSPVSSPRHSQPKPKISSPPTTSSPPPIASYKVLERERPSWPM